MRFDRRTFLRSIGAGAVAPAVGLFDRTATAATVITIRGGGADIWNTEDAFHFYYETVDGDFDVQVRNTALENTDPNAKTGIMARNSEDPGAPNVLLRRTPSGAASLQWRSESGSETISTTSGGEDESELDGGSLQAEWLRLRRQGDVFEAYGSDDGTDWTTIARLDGVELSDSALVGLPVTSHNVGVRCTARLRDLSGIDPDTNRDVGDVSVTGSVETEEGVPFVTTGDATDVTARKATLRGELTDLGGADAASCYVEYREVPSAAWTATAAQTRTEPGTFDVRLTDLTSRRYYEYRAVVETENGDRTVGSSETVGTPSQSNGGSNGGGPDSASRVDFADGFAVPAPWLDDDTPIIPVTEPNRRQLAAAVGIDGPRLVVFETSGTVDLGKQRLTVSSDELYLAGQTAPSPGITLVQGDLWIDADDCVIQHLRVRPGDANLTEESDWEPDGIRTGDGTQNNVIDHCTTTWAVDENLSVGYDTVNTTVSNCLIAEPLQDATHHKGDHGYGSLIGNGASNVTLAGNVWAHNYDRNPRLKQGTRTVVANNVIYHYNDGVWMDPDTEASIESNVFRRPVSDQLAVFGEGAAALDDNVATTPTTSEGITQLDTRPLWPTALETVGSENVVEHNLTNAGARPADRTAADERVLEQLRTEGGSYIDSQTEVGGYPELEVVTHRLTIPQGGTRAWLRAKARAVE
ncbi:pectate lyase [Halocatena salina]|uniref:Pectate lyase n=1 Tax=Halocatena salina TaxID=2934340 RepID=A0A8U0A503_9EURY|nr:pectate lyase [Halocatena salina]UPM44290.1 pectate lyase [Halocatena salina]